MRRDFLLTAGNPGFSTTVDFESTAIVVANPTSSPVFLRLGSIDQPSAVDAQVIVPAATAQSYPVSGRMFAGVFGTPSLVAAGAASLSGLFSTATVTLLDGSESIPSYGAYSFLSLSVSELLPLAPWSGSLTGPTVDLGAWGGALISIFPDPTSGQGIVTVQASADRLVWQTLNSWAVWPGSNVAIQVPRTLRYLRINLGSAGIAGDAAIGGSYAVRATMQELAQLTYSQSSLGIVKTLAVPHLGTVSTVYATIGLPSVSIRWQPSTASGSAGQMVWYSSPTPGGPWALVAYREQQMAGSLASLYRSIGALDKYLRVDVLDTDVTAGGFGGDLTATTLPDADQTQYLQSILAALGDIGMATPNVNQDIFHLLAHVEQWTNQSGTSLASLDGKASTVLSNQTAIISGQSAQLGRLANIDTSTSNTNAYAAAYLPSLPTISTNTAGLPTLAATIGRGVSPWPGSLVGYGASGSWGVVNLFNGPLQIGWWVISIKLSYTLRWGAGSAIQTFLYALGGSGPVAYMGIETATAVLDPHGAFVLGATERKQFDGTRAGGLGVPSGGQNVLVNLTSGAVDAGHTADIYVDLVISTS